YLHIVPGADDVANGMARVARLLAKEQGDAEVVDLNNGKRELGRGKRELGRGEGILRRPKGGVAEGDALAGVGMGSGKGEEFGVESLEEVWVHGMWLPKEWAICRRVIKAGKRLMRMTHGSLSPIYLKQQGRWKKWLVGPIERYWLRKADRIVATCDAEKAWIEAYLGQKCPEIVVEDVKRFYNLKWEKGSGKWEKRRECGEVDSNNKKLNVLYLGRRHPLKGVEYLERAVREISTRSTRSTRLNIELRIVSDAKGEELEKVWEWCDVLVLPTLSENFGLVVAEALERGKRVITTDGAPAWGEIGKREVGKGKREDVGERLIYLRGFRDGSEKERIKLLKDALMMMV
ncbi:MAG: glycosyltransferase, partial [Kiritimatiellae bacterium]|nr:glycosyltransferase [Kiritimatiellia bacterium]